MASIEATFLKRTGESKYPKEGTVFFPPKLPLKLIEPTFSKFRVSCVHKTERERSRVSMCFFLLFYLSLFHPTFSEKQTWAKYRRAQLLLQYYKAKVS